MITLKTPQQIEMMRRAGAVVGGALEAVRAVVKPGVTTKALGAIIHDYITGHGAVPSFLHYNGFPASACISVNEVVVHGIPSKRILRQGDIVGVDIGAILDGWQGDAAKTFAVGEVSDQAKKLMRVTRESFYLALEQCRVGARLGDIGAAVQRHAEQNGFSVVRDLCGHGIGTNLHEDPEVPNFGRAGHGIRLSSGMVIAIEPMLNEGTHRVRTLADEWTVVTADESLSAHYEHTVAITDEGPLILTLPPEE